jgi:hypothetical protein
MLARQCPSRFLAISSLPLARLYDASDQALRRYLESRPHERTGGDDCTLADFSLVHDDCAMLTNASHSTTQPCSTAPWPIWPLPRTIVCARKAVQDAAVLNIDPAATMRPKPRKLPAVRRTARSDDDITDENRRG